MEPVELIDTLYGALARRDHEAMAACYHDEATFTDPVFEDLEGPEIAAMWHMLCEQGTDLEVEHANVTVDGDTGSATWQARYTFGASGRRIHNKISSAFTFEDGLIRTQVDSFDLYRWIRQAVGWSGVLVGWTSNAKGKVRDLAEDNLDRFLEKHPEYGIEIDRDDD